MTKHRDKDSVILRTPGGQDVEVGVIKRRFPIIHPKRMVIYVPVYDKKLMNYLHARIKEDLMAGEDFIIKITGPRRKGKSTVGISLAQTNSPLSLDDIVFTSEDFGKRASQLPASEPAQDLFSQIIFDEAGYGMFNQRWYDREQQDIVRLLEVNAAKRLVIYFISPHNDFINKAIRGSTMAKLWIDLGPAAKYGKGWVSLWEGVYTQFETGGYWKPLCVFQVEALKGEFWDRYMVKKLKFIDEAGLKTKKSRRKTTMTTPKTIIDDDFDN